MWIFTRRGFISAVQHREEPDTLVVRARAKGHLTALFGSSAKPETVKGSDYPWRVYVSKDELVRIVAREVLGIDYANFKSSVKNDLYHDTLMDIWTAGLRLEGGRAKHNTRRFGKRTTGQRPLFEGLDHLDSTPPFRLHDARGRKK